MSFFRNLFGRRSDAGKADGTATLMPPPPPPSPDLAMPVPQPKIAPPAPHAATHADAPTPPPSHTPEPAEGPISPEYCVPLPLKAITDLFPQDLKATLRKQPSEHVHVGIPRSLIEPQLAGGAVRITFAQLRAATPEIFFHPHGGPADAKVSIPLDAILRELMPSRREDQREISIPGNIPSVFAKAGTPAQYRASAGAEPWYSHRRPTYDGPGTDIPPDAESPPDSALPAPPEPSPAPAAVKPAAPAKPAAAIRDPLPSPDRILRMPAVEHAAPPRPAAAAPEAAPASPLPPPATEPATPANPTPAAAATSWPASILPAKSLAPTPATPPPADPKPSAPSTPPVLAAEPAAPAKPAPAPAEESWAASLIRARAAKQVASEPSAPEPETPAPVVAETLPAPKPEPPAPVVAEVPTAPSPAEPVPDPDSVTVPLTTILTALPEGIRQAMNGLDPATRSFQIPFTDFENQMRSGKLRFKWSKLQGWCRPEPFAASAADVDVDLPLASLVPLFLEKHKAPDARKKLEVDSRIPDVFAKSSYPAPPPAPAPGPATEPEPIPSAEAAPALEPAPAIPEPEPIPEAASIAVPAAEPESNAEPEPAPEPTPTAEAAPVPTPELAPAPAEPAVPAPAATSEPLPFPVAATMGGISDGPSIAHAPAAATVTPFRVEQPPTGPKPSNPSAQALQRIRALDGVSGAFLATVDGLLIAADLPDGNDNILAAFAPTVFAQLAKYCDMARLGVPLSFDLHLGATNIHVRKTGKIYLGVLSANGRPLPVAELNLIAVTL